VAAEDPGDGAPQAGASPPTIRIGVAELRRRPGNRQHVEREVAVGPIAITTASVPPPHEVHLDVAMEALSDGVTVSGTVAVPWVGECRRCLEPTSGVVEAELAEVFKDRPDDGDDPTGAELLRLDGDAVDLGPSVHDAAVLALPLAPLCREDCAGPDPEAFPVQTADEPAEAPVDPRWAALSELRFDVEAPESLE
jgi:uncharacterized protein